MIKELTNKLQELLTKDAEVFSKKSGFVQRESKLTGEKFAKGLIFGWQNNPDASINQLRQMVSSFDVTISEQGLEKRFSKYSAHFFEMLLNKAIKVLTSSKEINSGLLSKFTDVKIYDSSTITLPYELIDEWVGTGNRLGSKANSTLKLSACLSLKSGRLNIVLEDGFVQDKSSELIRTEVIEQKSLTIKDLGYFKLDSFDKIEKQGGYFVSRVKVNTKIYNLSNNEIDIAKLMKDKKFLERDIYVGQKQKLKCRLIVLRLPEEMTEKRFEMLLKDSVRKQKPLTDKKRELLEFNIFITNVPEDLLSFQEVLILMKSRWQIELLFKLWKSYCKIDKSRSEKVYRFLTEIYAKLLGAIISHQLMIIAIWEYMDRSLFKAIKVIQDFSSILAYAFTKTKKDIIQAIKFICFRIKQCKINKRDKEPASFQLLLGLKDLSYA